MKRSFPVTGFCLALLVFFYLSSPAQTKVQGSSPAETQDQAHKDSLENALAAAPADSIRLKLLWNLDQAYLSTNPAKSLEYEKQRLAIGLKNNDLYTQTAAYISMSRAAISAMRSKASQGSQGGYPVGGPGRGGETGAFNYR